MASLLLSITLLCLSLLSGVYSVKLTITNNCSYTVWPALNSDRNTHLPTTGFTLQPSEAITIYVPNSWLGTLWGRTACSHHNSTGAFSCKTGDCGSSTIECNGRKAWPQITNAEFNISQPRSHIRVSKMIYNLPMTVVVQGGIGGSCDGSGCFVDMMSGGERNAASKSVMCNNEGNKTNCCIPAPDNPKPCNMLLSMGDIRTNYCSDANGSGYDEGTGATGCSYSRPGNFVIIEISSAADNYLITFCTPPALRI